VDRIFSLFSDQFLLRSPVLPKNAEWGTWEGGLAEEAVLVSSPSLAQRWEKIVSGVNMPAKVVDRAVQSLERYRLRMTSRPTPFGLMAGVAVGSFAGTTASAEIGRHHWKRVQPDRAWLSAVLAARVRQTGLGSRGDTLVVVNNTCYVQGERVIVPVVARAGENKRLTVRRTAAVDAVLNEAERPVPAADVRQKLADRFPHVPGERIWKLLDGLIDAEVLLADWYPSLGDADPLAGLLARDGSWVDMARYKEVFDAYQMTSPGAGYQALSALYAETGSTKAVHVDLALDADVSLPRAVAAEIERAADVLWRLSPPEHPFQRALRAYHREFWERYSHGELVPVTRLLNEDTGLGAPAGYGRPAGYRAMPPGEGSRPDREGLLIGMAMDAVASGRRHIGLTDDLIAALECDTGEPPRSADIFVSVNAVSPQAIEDGDFTVSVSPITAAQQAGAAWGRFTDLLGVADLLKTFVQAGDDVLPVQIAFPAYKGHLSNVLSVPRVCDRYLVIGAFDDTRLPGHLRVQDILVGADAHGFRLYHGPSNREIRCVVPHMLNRQYVPNIARFLWEASMMNTRPLSGWDWGAAENSPFLPGVGYGRVVLSPATWRLTAADLSGETAQSGLSLWRDRWRVPDRVRLAFEDRFLSLDLSIPGHRRVLFDEARKGACVVHEDLSPGLGEGWLRGPDGFHAAEIVVPLRAMPRRTSRPWRPAPARVRQVAADHMPGGNWVSAYLYCSPEAQREILGHHLEIWTGSLSDRWFFIRYTDPVDHRPHLRLRAHGDVLSGFHKWCGTLIEAGLVNDVTLHTYRPEIERYGGQSAITAAEEFFHADSRLALTRLRDGADNLDTAQDVIALIRVFQAEMRQDWADWVLTTYAKKERLHRSFAASRRDALARIAVDAPLTRQTEFWSNSLRAYAKVVMRAADEERWVDPSAILRSIIHMHCNRVLYPVPDAEDTIYAIVRGVVEAHASRERSQH
jgi:lantibiotic biosynthesis protein